MSPKSLLAAFNWGQNSLTQWRWLNQLFHHLFDEWIETATNQKTFDKFQVDLFPIVQTDLLLFNALFLNCLFLLKPQFSIFLSFKWQKSGRFDSIETNMIRRIRKRHTINVTSGDNHCSTFLNEMLNGKSEQINCKQLRVIIERCHLHELPLISFWVL